MSIDNLPNWYGFVNGVKFKNNGPMSDPELIYNGRSFNYWDIECGLYEMFRDYLREEFPGDEYLESVDYDTSTEDSHFTDWLENNNETITGYFDDVISGGYFNEGY